MKTKNTLPQTVPSTNGFTLIEMLVVIAIIGLLASLMVPAVTGSLRRAKEVTKVSNLRSMHQANMMYSMDHNSAVCPVEDEVNHSGGHNWRDLLAPYLARESESRGEANDERIFIDPFFKEYTEDKKYLTGYGFNRNPGLPEEPKPNALKGEAWDMIFYMDTITQPSGRIMIGDTGNQWFISKNQYETQIDTTRHKGKGMFLLFDGSIRKLTQEEAEKAFVNP